MGTTTKGAIIKTKLLAAAGSLMAAAATVSVANLVLIGVPPDATNECSAVAYPPTVTATGSCPSNVVVQLAVATNAGSCPQAYTLVRVWTATDGCSNSVSATQRVTVVDTTPPTFLSVPANTGAACGSVPGATVQVIDNCSPSGSVVRVTTTNAGACAGNYTLTRVWTATDPCGNSSYATQLVFVTDTTPPVITGVPADTNVACYDLPPVPPVQASDCVLPTLVRTDVTNAGACAGTYVLLRIWTASDPCGNTSIQTQRIAVTDTEAPVLVGVPADTNAVCDNIPAPPVVTATESCSPTVSVVFVQVTNAGPCMATFTLRRIWTAADGCGNSAQATQLVYVTDATAPTLVGVPAPMTTRWDWVAGPGGVSASDACSTLTVSFAESTNANPHGYDLVRVWTALDACGNAAAATQAVTAIDASDADGDGIPGWWEWTYYGGPTNAAPDADTDGDRVPALAEYGADTVPTSGLSFLRLVNIGGVPGLRVVDWKGGVEAWQVLELLHDGPSGGVWSAILTNAPPTPVDMSHTGAMPPGAASGQFRIRAAR